MNQAIFLLDYLKLQPSSYRFIFPDYLTSEEIDKMAGDGIFPKISDLFEAIKYTICLSIIRYVLHLIIFKVKISTLKM